MAEIAQVLFVDFVGFSKLLTDRQHEIKQILQAEVRSSAEYQRARESGELVVRDTGDGFAFVSRSRDPEAVAKLAVEIATTLKHRDLPVRMGLNVGPVTFGTDLDNSANVTGAGINEAQRVMDCGGAGHILLGESAAKALVGLSAWNEAIRDLGEQTVKHGLKLRIYSIVRVDVGSSAALVAAPAHTPTIAVLPFVNSSSDPENEYFSDGLAEEVINALAKLKGLRVIARTSAFSFKGRTTDIREIARALDVAHILEGSVRKSGNRVRITVQLVVANDGGQIWSERYDATLDDVFAVQDEIATAIASALRVTLAADRKRTYVPNSAAYDALLKAKHHLFQSSPEQVARAREYCEAAIQADPGYAQAYCVLAQAYFYPVMFGSAQPRPSLARIREIAQQAVAADPLLGDGHAMLGLVSAYLDFDWDAARVSFERAMQDEPVPTDSRRFWAFSYLLPQGRAAEAVTQLKLALEEDPLHPHLHFQLAIAQCANDRLDASIAQMQTLRDLHPGVFFSYTGLSLFHSHLGEWDTALPFAKRAYELAPWNSVCAGNYAAVLTRCKQPELAAQLLSNADAQAVASYHALLGEWDEVFPYWEQTATERDPRLFTALFFYQRQLRDDPRWHRLQQMLRLA